MTVKAINKTLYDHPSEMEPLLPGDGGANGEERKESETGMGIMIAPSLGVNLERALPREACP